MLFRFRLGKERRAQDRRREQQQEELWGQPSRLHRWHLASREVADSCTFCCWGESVSGSRRCSEKLQIDPLRAFLPALQPHGAAVALSLFAVANAIGKIRGVSCFVCWQRVDFRAGSRVSLSARSWRL